MCFFYFTLLLNIMFHIKRLTYLLISRNSDRLYKVHRSNAIKFYS